MLRPRDAATPVRYLRLVAADPPKLDDPPPMPLWQAWVSAHWYVGWSIAQAMYDSWDRAMSGRRE